MGAQEPTLSQQLDNALRLLNLDSLRQDSPAHLTESQQALWDATMKSLEIEAQNLKEFADKAGLNAPNSPSRVKAGMQNPLDVINFLRGPGGKVYMAAVTRREHIEDKIEAHNEQYYADAAAKKKLIRNILLLAGLSRLSRRRAHAAEVNAAINEEIRQADERVSNDSDSLSSLLDNERLLEDTLSRLDDDIAQNDEQYEILQKELENSDKLFEDNQALHQQTDSLLDPNNKPTPEQVSTHRAKLKAKLGEHQQAIKTLTAGQLADRAPDGQAQSNLQVMQQRMLAMDARLDLVLIAEAMNDLESVYEEFESARMAPAPREGSKFSHVIERLAELGIIDPAEEHDEASLAKHCGHCELFDEEGHIVPHHQRGNAASYMQVSRDERLIHKDGNVFLIPKSMTDDEFDKAHREGKAEPFRNKADSRRQAVARHAYKRHLENACQDNRSKHRELIATRDSCRAELNEVREQIEVVTVRLEASMQAANQLYEQAGLEQQVPPKEKATAPTPKPGGQAFLRDAEAILNSRDLTSLQKYQQIKQMMPKAAVDKLMPELAKMEHSLLSDTGQDVDAFRNEFAEMLRQNGNLFNEYRAVSGPYKEVEAEGPNLAQEREAQLGTATKPEPQEPQAEEESRTSPTPFSTTPKPGS